MCCADVGVCRWGCTLEFKSPVQSGFFAFFGRGLDWTALGSLGMVHGPLKDQSKTTKKNQSKPLKTWFFCILLMFFTSKACQIASKYYVYTVVIMYQSLHIYLCHISSKKISFTPLKTHCRPKLACNIGVFIPYIYCLHNAVSTGCNQSFSSFSEVGNWQLHVESNTLTT